MSRRSCAIGLADVLTRRVVVAAGCSWTMKASLLVTHQIPREMMDNVLVEPGFRWRRSGQPYG